MSPRPSRIVPIALLLLLSACSKSDTTVSQSGPRPGPEATPALSVPIGGGPGELKADIPDEGSPEGPTAFVVDAAGRIHVLDNINAAVLVFEGGKQVAKVDLPARAFDDLEVLDDGTYALLDRFTAPGITFVQPDGKITSLVPLDPELVGDPAMITALVRYDSSLWVEIEEERLVRIATFDGGLAQGDVLLGKLPRNGSTLGVKLSGKSLDVTLDPVPGEPAKTFAHLSFPEDVSQCSLLANGPDDRVLVAARLLTEPDDPDQEAVETHVLVSLTPNGKEQWRSELPPFPDAARVFRGVRVGADGNVYALTSSDTGVTIVKVTP